MRSEDRTAEATDIIRQLLGDLTDAERAVAAWRAPLTGMGVNITQESRGRFPSLSYKSHRTRAEAFVGETIDLATGLPYSKPIDHVAG